jgi:hypothetical protein
MAAMPLIESGARPADFIQSRWKLTSATNVAPTECPLRNSVPGSPPNFAMFLLIQMIAALVSSLCAG